MAEQKATHVCLVATAAYPEARHETLVQAPPIGYLLRIERETPDAIYRCIYSVSEGRRIHDGACRYADGSGEVEESEAPAEAPVADATAVAEDGESPK